MIFGKWTHAPFEMWNKIAIHVEHLCTDFDYPLTPGNRFKFISNYFQFAQGAPSGPHGDPFPEIMFHSMIKPKRAATHGVDLRKSYPCQTLVL